MTDTCCSEFATLTRRRLLGGAALAGTTALFGSTVLTTGASAAATARSVLLVLSLRGAADGLSLVVPHGDPVYYTARPRIAVPVPALLARDDFFGLHPALAPLVPLWTAGKMAAVHATGLPAPNRSHFAAMEEVEDAAPGSSTRAGWLNRLLGADGNRSLLQGFAVTSGVPPSSFFGPEPFLATDEIDGLEVAGNDGWDPRGRRMRSLHTLWDDAGSEMAQAMGTVFNTLRDVQPIRQTPATPKNGADYGSSDVGDAMQTAARVIRGDVGVEVMTVDHGDWDMHTDLGTVQRGRMEQQARELGTALAAFFTDLGALGDKVTVVVLSEFGRRVRENANNGLDHGYGNVMFVLGAGVRGGQYYGSWPGLTGDLDSDLLVTTDYRTVLSEVVSSRFGVSTASVFPGFQPATSLGLMRST